MRVSAIEVFRYFWIAGIRGGSMTTNWKESRRVTIAEALAIVKDNPGAEVYWRPEPDLPEEQQYALVANE